MSIITCLCTAGFHYFLQSPFLSVNEAALPIGSNKVIIDYYASGTRALERHAIVLIGYRHAFGMCSIAKLEFRAQSLQVAAYSCTRCWPGTLRAYIRFDMHGHEEKARLCSDLSNSSVLWHLLIFRPCFDFALFCSTSRIHHPRLRRPVSHFVCGLEILDLVKRNSYPTKRIQPRPW